MLRSGHRIRLTRREVERFTDITGIAPVDVTSLEAFDAYVNRCKHQFGGDSRDAQFLRWLIERERSACLRAGDCIA